MNKRNKTETVLQRTNRQEEVRRVRQRMEIKRYKPAVLK